MVVGLVSYSHTRILLKQRQQPTQDKGHHLALQQIDLAPPEQMHPHHPE
jgi:hypothetical protein